MAEEVQTGGLKKFRTEGKARRLEESEKREIREAYEKAEERKKKQKRNWIIIWIILILIFLGIASVFMSG